MSTSRIGALMVIVGLVLFTYAIFDVTSGMFGGAAPSWLLFVGTALWTIGLFVYASGGRSAAFGGRGATAIPPPGPSAAAPAPPASPRPSADPLDRLARLAELRDSGALTDAEFEAQKAKLLSE